MRKGPTFRTPEMSEKYRKHLETHDHSAVCPLCSDESVTKAFTHWKILPNLFPYDKVMAVHDMLVPKRHVTEADLTEEEQEELALLKQSYINEHYFFIMEATASTKTVPLHFHLHLVVPKE